MSKRTLLAVWGLAIGCTGCPGGGSQRPRATDRRVLTVHTHGPGTVISDPQGIRCGDTCSASFERGTAVTLSAIAGESATFVGWQGPCTGRTPCRVSVDTDLTVSAAWDERAPVRERLPIDAGSTGLGDSRGEAAGGDARDRDGDGVSDALDRCADAPEDVDGFEDADGCPDPDNDADGLSDMDDLCPSASEDRDGFEDEDGCPEPDNDRDGILDFDDQCPNLPETMNGFDDYDGCPDRIP